MGTAQLGFLAAALLSSAEPAAAPTVKALPPLGPTARDGYSFEVRDHVATKMLVEVVLHKDYESLRKAHERSDKVPTSDGPGSDKYKVAAFTLWWKLGDNAVKCEIHIVDPAIEYRPETFGHEVTHCLYGSFHPTQPR